MPIKSPFLIIENFLSPLECDNILTYCSNIFPDEDNTGKEIKTVVKNALMQSRVWKRTEEYYNFIEKYYNVSISEQTSVDIEIYPEGCSQEKVRCENSAFINNSWKIINDYDFTVIVFLKSYNDTKEFDRDFECYGGKLEFLNHKFGFNPIQGNAIIFPSNQYFLNCTTSPKAADMLQLRYNLICDNKFKYDPTKYAGTYSDWFPD